MGFKTGDKIKIKRGAFVIDLTSAARTRAGQYLTQAYSGVVVSTNCQLSNSNCTLLVKAGVEYLFVSPAEVSLAKPPKYYAYIFGSIKMEITKKQYDEIEEATKTIAGHLIPGLLEVD